jgi:hypothetical protein
MELWSMRQSHAKKHIVINRLSVFGGVHHYGGGVINELLNQTAWA